VNALRSAVRRDVPVAAAFFRAGGAVSAGFTVGLNGLEPAVAARPDFFTPGFFMPGFFTCGKRSAR